MLSLVEVLKDYPELSAELFVLGKAILPASFKYKGKIFVEEADHYFFKKMLNFIFKKNVKAIVIDFHISDCNQNLTDFLAVLKSLKVKILAVDCLINDPSLVDYIWLPTVFYDEKSEINIGSNGMLSYGWDHFLLRKSDDTVNWRPGVEIVIMTGGSDVAGLGNWWPTVIDRNLSVPKIIHWIQGPYSDEPQIPRKSKHDWQLHKNPTELNHIMLRSNYALSLFGVSFFQLLKFGVPTVVVSVNETALQPELKLISDEEVAIVSDDVDTAVKDLALLTENYSLSKSISEKAKRKMVVNGCDLLIRKLSELLVR